MTGAPGRVLVVRLSSLGDCVHALPAVAALAEAGFEVGWAIQERWAPLIAGHPQVARLHRSPGAGRGSLRFLRELRAARYPVAIDLQGLTRSAWVSWASGARRRIAFGRPEGRELAPLLATCRVPPVAGGHVVERNLALLAPLGLEAVRPPPPRFPDYRRETEELRSLLAGWWAPGAPLAVLQPGTTWDTKRWPARRFATVARALDRRFHLPVLVLWGDEFERLTAERVAASAGGRVRVAPPLPLRHLAALLAFPVLAVGGDTGPMHLAAARGAPCVMVMGATDPVRNGPHGEDHRAVTSSGLPCQPCCSRRCGRGDLACLRQVDAELVVRACEERLAGALARRRSG